MHSQIRLPHVADVDIRFRLPETMMVFAPAVDCFKSPDAYLFQVGLPGRCTYSVKVSDAGGPGRRLIITGEKPNHVRNSFWRPVSGECATGPFRRELELPVDANADGLETRYGQGVLSIYVPRLAAVLSVRQSAKHVAAA